MSEEIQEEVQMTSKREDKIASPRVIPVIDHRLLASKLAVHDWMQEIPSGVTPPGLVEVRFKNTRKGFFTNPANIPLKAGDIVAVEATLGHDIGIVSLTGELVQEQIRLKRVDVTRNPLKKVYRKAKSHDIDKWKDAIALEHATMIKSREIAADLKLDMKIGDVEYQGDKTKAIFYYIAGDRVDFRKLIKVLADTFHIRVEMKQIGARQEAGRLGGIGSCGRELCCCSFITNFISVSTSAARYQDVSLNPQKLAGQCGKLKCCLNFELDAYVDGQKDFPSSNTWLNTGEGMLYFQKSDIFGRTISYSFDKEGRGAIVKLPVERVKEIIAMNKRGQIPPKALIVDNEAYADIKYTDGVGEESLNRFDDKKQKKHNNRNRNRKKNLQKKEGDGPNAPSTKAPAMPDNGNREDTANSNVPKTITYKGERHLEKRGDRLNRPRLTKPRIVPKPESEA
ncbi:MAG: hypothetical protein LBP56_07440 [Odoribacteraceae bacterium]|jgi:cell fate regulator YaaT (PSP1 superfamily)|nr:hypothetical protein [Odoribacteraceae bacterium]